MIAIARLWRRRSVVLRPADQSVSYVLHVGEPRNTDSSLAGLGTAAGEALHILHYIQILGNLTCLLKDVTEDRRQESILKVVGLTPRGASEM